MADSRQPAGQPDDAAASDRIIQQIADAFADTEYPGRDALVNDHCPECAEVSAAYAGKRWNEVTLDDVLRGREVALLTAAAWRYYLPALMIWIMRAPEAVDVLQDNLVYQLEPPGGDQGVPEWFEKRAGGFSVKQRFAIVGFLDWYRVREEATWSLLGADAPLHVYNALAYWAAGTVGGERLRQ